MKKKNIFHERNLNFTKNNAFNDVFCDRTFPYYRFSKHFLKRLDFHESWLIFSGKIFSTTLLFPIFKIKSSNMLIFKKIF